MEYFGVKIKYTPTQGMGRTYYFLANVEEVHHAIQKAMDELEFDKYEIYTLDISVIKISSFMANKQVRHWM